MIWQVIGRGISNGDGVIGKQGENNASNIIFVITDPILYDQSFKLDIDYTDGRKDIVMLHKARVGEEIQLTWIVRTEHLYKAGTIHIQLRTLDTTDMVWKSDVHHVTVGYSINAPQSFPPSLPSEFTEMEIRLTQMVDRAENFEADFNNVASNATNDFNVIVANANVTIDKKVETATNQANLATGDADRARGIADGLADSTYSKAKSDQRYGNAIIGEATGDIAHSDDIFVGGHYPEVGVYAKSRTGRYEAVGESTQTGIPTPENAVAIVSNITKGNYQYTDEETGQMYTFNLPIDMHGIGEYRDVLWYAKGKMWFYRKIDSQVSPRANSLGIATGNNYFTRVVPDSPNVSAVKSTHFRSRGQTATKGDIYIAGKNPESCFMYLNDQTIDTIAKFNAWVHTQTAIPLQNITAMLNPVITAIALTPVTSSTLPVIPIKWNPNAVPSPDFPVQTIASVSSENVVVGDNLLDLYSNKIRLENCIKVGDALKSSISNSYYCGIKIIDKDLINKICDNQITFSLNNITKNEITIVIYGDTLYEINNNTNMITTQLNRYPKNIHVIEFRFNRKHTPFTDTTSVFTNIQINLGATAKLYQPYDGKTYPITPKFEGCSIGSVADWREMVSGVETRRTFNRIFDGTENFVLFEGKLHTFYVTHRNYEIYVDGISTHFKGVPQSDFDKLDGFYTLRSNRTYISMIAMDNVPQLKSWVKSQYDNGTPLTITYELATPTTTQYAPTTIIQDKTLYANQGRVKTTYTKDINQVLNQRELEQATENTNIWAEIAQLKINGGI